MPRYAFDRNRVGTDSTASAAHNHGKRLVAACSAVVRTRGRVRKPGGEGGRSAGTLAAVLRAALYDTPRRAHGRARDHTFRCDRRRCTHSGVDSRHPLAVAVARSSDIRWHYIVYTRAYTRRRVARAGRSDTFGKATDRCCARDDRRCATRNAHRREAALPRARSFGSGAVRRFSGARTAWSCHIGRKRRSWPGPEQRRRQTQTSRRRWRILPQDH